MAALARWWRALREPSIVRRLVLAQLATLLLVWAAFLALVLRDVMNVDGPRELQQARLSADTILGTAADLLEQPQALQRFMQQMDRAGARGSDPEALAAGRVSITLRVDGQAVFVTPGPPGALPPTADGAFEYVEHDGVRWLSYTQSAHNGRLSVSFHRLADTSALAIWTLSSGILLLPLLLALPFLVLAAWLSVRLALQPWRTFSADVALRHPNDLSPLSVRSRHRELVPVAEAVNGLLERVREGMERERSFVADAAHELRTPLAALRINAEALQQHANGPRQTMLLASLIAGMDRAGRLVSQLLSLTRSEAAGPAQGFDCLDLTALVQERLAALAPIADEADIELELTANDHAWVQGSAQSLTSLVDNLVQNAIKYSPPGTRVRVATAMDSQGVRLVVEDEGPGIAPHLHRRVFDRFYRAPDQDTPGSGLGLAIVKAVADHHGARIDLGVPQGGRGLVVSLLFPAARS